jgi:hypothetical protein
MKSMDGRVEPKFTDGDLEGLDESQRAEVHEYEGGGPTDGVLLTDMARDRGEDFVEDDRQPEIMPDQVDALGMSILTPESVGDDAVDGELDDELDGADGDDGL